MCKDETYYIYCLSDPRTFKPRYVGQTKDVKMRYSSHCAAIYTDVQINHKLLCWFDELRILGVYPEFVLIEEVSGKDKAIEREAEYISLIRDFGGDLCNIMSSGINNHKLF